MHTPTLVVLPTPVGGFSWSTAEREREREKEREREREKRGEVSWAWREVEEHMTQHLSDAEHTRSSSITLEPSKQ